MKTNSPVVLSIYPNKWGFGYVVLEQPQTLIDYAMVSVKPLTNAKLFIRFVKLVDYFKPVIILVRDCDIGATRTSKRTQDLVEEITKYAKEQKLPVFHYSRHQVKDVFEQLHASSKYEISKKIVEALPELKLTVPKPRSAWSDEDYNMGIFDAIALAITHNYLTE